MMAEVESLEDVRYDKFEDVTLMNLIISSKR